MESVFNLQPHSFRDIWLLTDKVKPTGILNVDIWAFKELLRKLFLVLEGKVGLANIRKAHSGPQHPTFVLSMKPPRCH